MKSKLPTPPFAEGNCIISDEWDYKGMKTIWMENDFIKIGILADRGSDIFEFRYKPLDVDFMLRLSKGIRNPQKDFSQMRDTPNQFEDYYYGGWQEILPNTPSFNYRGASLGQHGEVSLTPWKYAILDSSQKKVSVKLWTTPLRVPVKIEKTLSIVFDQPTLFIEEKLSNESKTNLDIVWGHHIAFGLPFLTEGAKIETNAKKIISEPTMPDHRRFKPGIESQWPKCKNIDGKEDDASNIPPAEDPPYSDLSYLYGFGDEGNYSIINTDKNVGFNVNWDAKLFKYLWYWQERYATQDAPWWGNAYAVALEPWTSMFKPDAEEAIKKGEWLSIKPDDVIKTKLSASVIIT
jgi:galactose mutarotase-like enzyme